MHRITHRCKNKKSRQVENLIPDGSIWMLTVYPSHYIFQICQAFLCTPKEGLSQRSLKADLKWHMDVGEFTVEHLLLRAIREVWARLECHSGSSYDHLATYTTSGLPTITPQLDGCKSHQQAHGDICLTCSHRGRGRGDRELYIFELTRAGLGSHR